MQRQFSAQREAFISQLQENMCEQMTPHKNTKPKEMCVEKQYERLHVRPCYSKPVYRRYRLDVDGMRFIQSAIYQANHTSQSDHALPLWLNPQSDSMGDLLRYAIDVTQQYGECASRHKAFAESIGRSLSKTFQLTSFDYAILN